MFERRAGDGMQEVDRQGVDPETARLVGEVDNVVVLFSHPDDSAATCRESSPAYVFHRADTVVEGVGGADLRIEAPAGVEVMVYPSGACLLENPRLLFAHQPQREAKLQGGELFADSLAGFGHVLDDRAVGSAHTGHHAVAL